MGLTAVGLGVFSALFVLALNVGMLALAVYIVVIVLQAMEVL